MDYTGNFSERFTLQREFENLTLWFDGSCFPNPDGNIGFGWQVFNGEALIAEGWGLEIYTGARSTSNNLAEFMALNSGLRYLIDSRIIFENLAVFGDSQFVISMCEGRYRISENKGYSPAALEFKEKIEPCLKNITYTWISRDYNIACDALAERYLHLMLNVST